MVSKVRVEYSWAGHAPRPIDSVRPFTHTLKKEKKNKTVAGHTYKGVVTMAAELSHPDVQMHDDSSVGLTQELEQIVQQLPPPGLSPAAGVASASPSGAVPSPVVSVSDRLLQDLVSDESLHISSSYKQHNKLGQHKERWA